MATLYWHINASSRTLAVHAFQFFYPFWKEIVTYVLVKCVSELSL